MKIQGLLILILISLAGCINTNTPEHYIEAKPQQENQNSLINISANNQPFSLHYGNDPGLENAFKRFAKTGNAPNIIHDNNIKFAYSQTQSPIINTAPLQETVISLEPGEKFTNVSSGDPTRWSYAIATSGGSDTLQQQHILVKPSQPDLKTNMVVTTDRRMYNLRLISSMNTQLMKSVSFWYPEKMIESLNENIKKQNETIATIPDVSLKNLNFDYALTCGWFCRAPYWKPYRVFDDGVHTYIEFPASMSNRSMPVLFVLNENQKELTNYRSKPPYFVVDQIFKRAILVMGVGRSQIKLIITNHHIT